MRKIGKSNKPHPRSTRDANAEYLLLQSLALRIGQEAARQAGLTTTPYLPVGDPHGAHLARLEGVGDQPIKLRTTITIEVNPTTGAAIGFTPPPHPTRN